MLLLFIIFGLFYAATQWHGFWKVIVLIVATMLAITIFQVLYCKFFPPIITPLMIKRYFEQLKLPVREKHFEWKVVPIELISHFLVDLANVAENSGLFLYDKGIAHHQLVVAYRHNRTSPSLKGGSTITQQTAKNCFLPHSRTWLRKVVEAYYVCLMDLFWSKKRIMECYLNIVEFGDGIYGCEAASQHYFHHSAATLTLEESALLIASLPWPLRGNPNSHFPDYDKLVLDVQSWLLYHGPIDWNVKLRDLDASKVRVCNRGLVYFICWLCLQKYNELKNTFNVKKTQK
jgi:monofunctional biosynthetic peptidoglycan transglycosylase